MKPRLWFSSFVLLVFGATPSFAQYWSALPAVDSKHASFAGFSNDEKRVYFISKQSGVENLWMVPVKGGTPTAVTKYTGNGTVRALHLLNRPFVVVERPTSANGDYHIYLQKDDGSGEAQDLTPTGAGVYNDIAGISYNGRYLYYRSNNPNKDKVDLWRYDTQQYTTEDVFPNDKDWQILSWSRDQGRLLAEDPNSGQLTMIDITSTERTPLVKPAAPYKTALWDPMNHELFYIESTGALKATNVSTGQSGDVTAAARGIQSGVESFDFSPNGKYMIIKTAAGWQVIDALTNTPVALPEGGVPVAIAPHETQLLYTVGPKLYLFDLNKKSSAELATIE